MKQASILKFQRQGTCGAFAVPRGRHEISALQHIRSLCYTRAWQARYGEAVMHLRDACTLAKEYWGSSSETYSAALAELAMVHLQNQEFDAAEALLLKVHPSLLLPSCHHLHPLSALLFVCETPQEFCNQALLLL